MSPTIFGVSYGAGGGSGLVSVEYMFKGESAHAAGAPWRGRSALDAVELMDVGWNFRREHLRLAHAHPLRHHQRRGSAQRGSAERRRLVLLPRSGLRAHHEPVAHRRQHGESRSADDRYDVDLSGCWDRRGPGYFNKPIAEDMDANIRKVGLPRWSAEDQTLAKALQKEFKVPVNGLATKISECVRRAAEKRTTIRAESEPTGGGSDDIGDISWNVRR